MIDQRYVFRAALLFQFKLGETAAESCRKLCKAFGENVISERQCQHWFLRFRDGDESLEDSEHGHRPLTMNLELLKESIESDPQQSTRELAYKFDCCQKTICNNLHRLGKTCRHGKWIPHLLSESNRNSRILLCSSLLSRSKNRGFFESIITSDEKWIQYDNPQKNCNGWAKVIGRYQPQKFKIKSIRYFFVSGGIYTV